MGAVELVAPVAVDVELQTQQLVIGKMVAVDTADRDRKTIKCFDVSNHSSIPHSRVTRLDDS